MDIHTQYDLWLEQATEDPDLQEELLQIRGNEEEILDRFYRKLEFGTAGLRGVIGAGTNRMNVYTVNQATQGLADFLKGKYEAPSVAIAYDSRIKSCYFAREAARVLAGNGIKVYLFEELVPTPVLSFAVRRFAASSGIIITASHNPSKYNGYKCYNPNGFQMTDQEADSTYACIQKVDCFRGVRRIPFEDAVDKGLIERIGTPVIEAFLDAVQTQCLNPQACRTADLNVIYTPLNGAGNRCVRAILDRIGITSVHPVPAQEQPDGNFPTCPYPNPEIRQAFEEALKVARTVPADLLLATDPDCDRVGIAVRNRDGEYQLMSGNEVGVLLLHYILSQRKAQGTLPKRPIAVKTIVSTPLTEEVARAYGCELKNLLTGFKYIGELITGLEDSGEADRFVFGYEESYGYLSGTHCRDKDAVVASMIICEMAAYYKREGKTLIEVMESIYETYGMYLNTVENTAFEGASGMEKMADIMSRLRERPPEAFGEQTVVSIADYQAGEIRDLRTGRTEPISLPASNVLAYTLDQGGSVIIRPSGTEPKIKVYITAVGKTRQCAEEITQALLADVKTYME